MNFNFKEFLKWITFIPASLLFGQLMSNIINLPTNYLTNQDSLLFKILASFVFWISTYWASAYIKPEQLPIKIFKRIWYVITAFFIAISVANFLYVPADKIAKIFEVIAPLLCIGMYPPENDLDQKTFRLCITSFLSGFLLLNSKEDIEKGAVGWKLPTIFLACYFLLEIIFKSYNGFPFAFVSFIGIVCEHTAVCTGLYAKDPSLNFKKYNFIKRFLLVLIVYSLGALLVRLGGVESVLPGFALSTYWIPPLIGLTYYPPDGYKH